MKDLTFNEEKKAARAAKLYLSYTKLKEKNGTYASGFFSMEILNLVNVCLQIFLTDVFLEGRFLNYGTRMAYYVRDWEIGGSDWNWSPMDEAFPKMSKCQFNKYGVGGGIQVEYKTIFYSVLSLLLHLEPRCHVHTASQHCQREDLPGVVVVVHHPSCQQRCGRPLQNCLLHVP